MSSLLALAQVPGVDRTSAARTVSCPFPCPKPAIPRTSRYRSCHQTSVNSRVFATSPATSPGLEESASTSSLNLYNRIEQLLDGRSQQTPRLVPMLSALDKTMVDAALRTHEAHTAISDAIRAHNNPSDQSEGVKEATEGYEGTLMQLKMLLVNRTDFNTLYPVVESIQAGLGPGPGFQVKPLSQPRPTLAPRDLRYWAVAWNDLRMLMLLLEYKYTPLPEHSKGSTALHCAAKRNFVEAAELLLSHGADVNSENKKGSTALHCAAEQNLVEIAELLLSHGADASLEDNQGNTALHVAAKSAGTGFVKLLLQYGGDPGKENAKGQVPFDLANRLGNEETLQLLVNASIAAEAWLYDDTPDDDEYREKVLKGG